MKRHPIVNVNRVNEGRKELKYFKVRFLSVWRQLHDFIVVCTMPGRLPFMITS